MLCLWSISFVVNFSHRAQCGILINVHTAKSAILFVVDALFLVNATGRKINIRDGVLKQTQTFKSRYR